MPKTTAQLAASKAGETAESNGFGSQERPLRPAGLYRLKDDDGNTVDEQIVKSHPKFGDSQAAAFERVGYKFVRAAKPGEVKEIEVDAAYLATENKSGGQDSNETLKGIQARLTAVEKENADLKAAASAETTKGASDDAVKTESKENAKEEAQTQLENRGQAPASGPTDLSDEDDDEFDDEDGTGEGEGSTDGDDEGEGDQTPEKPFGSLNRAELEELAAKEEITLPAEANTNNKIRDVITQARASKKAGN